jgi:MFS family permease
VSASSSSPAASTPSLVTGQGVTGSNTWDAFNDRQRWMLIFVLFLVMSSGAIDRTIVSIVFEPIKQEFHVSDTALGLMTGVAFGIFYAILGIPLGRYADRGDRRLLITVSVAVWSILTAACGWARSFLQIFLLRIGVGIGEAGGSGAPLFSLLADYYPPERRAKAIGFIQTSTISGAILGLIAGGYVAQYYGWRDTFILAGLPGLLLAAIAGLILREPRRHHNLVLPDPGGESTMDALRALTRKPTFIYTILAQTCFTFATSALIFDQSYVTRVLHVGVAETGLATGLLSIGSIIAGNAFGGILSDKLAKRDITWLCRLPGYGMMLTFPFYIGAHLVPGLVGYSLLGGIAGTLMVGVLPAMMSAMLAVVGGTRRATGLAIAMLFTNLVGLTLGPIVTGMLSDHLALSIGPAEGLRWSLILALSTFYPTGWFMLRAARTIQGDFEI